MKEIETRALPDTTSPQWNQVRLVSRIKRNLARPGSCIGAGLYLVAA